MGSTLGPWRWLRGCPENRRHDLIEIWAVILQGIVDATPRRDDPRLHVSDVIHDRRDELTPELARLFLDGIYKHMKWEDIMEQTGTLQATEYQVEKDGIIGTIDFLAKGKKFPMVVLDIKTVGEGNFERVKEGVPLPHHRDQVLQYLDMEPRAKFGVVVYEGRDELDLALCVVEPNPERAEAIRERRKARNRGDSGDGQAQGGEQGADPSLPPPSGPGDQPGGA